MGLLKNKKTKFINNVGQMTIEAVLILSMLLGVTIFLSNQFRENELLRKFVHGPWDRIAGMAQNGHWAPPGDSMSVHPNNRSRLVSRKGDTPQ